MPRQLTEKYGYPANSVPRALRLQIDSFAAWCHAGINMERSQRYARAVQTTTLDKNKGTMRAFLGWVDRYTPSPPPHPDISAYSNPQYFAAFTSYLLARDVRKGHVVKHVSLARKVNDYLQARAQPDSPARQRAAAMDEWLAKLEAQLNASMPSSVKETTPNAALVYAWASAVAERALQRADSDLEQLGCLTHAGAWLVQCALLAALVVGCYVPPCRLHILKTINHPRYYGSIPCDDPDCNIRNCRGNQFQASRAERLDGERRRGPELQSRVRGCQKAGPNCGACTHRHLNEPQVRGTLPAPQTLNPGLALHLPLPPKVVGLDEIRGSRSQLLEELGDELECEVVEDNGGGGGGWRATADGRRVRFIAAHHKNDRCGASRLLRCLRPTTLLVQGTHRARLGRGAVPRAHTWGGRALLRRDAPSSGPTRTHAGTPTPRPSST